MELIVSVDQNWGIGFRDALLARIPADLKRFRGMTLGKTVIVGRRTLATFPEGKPLPRRANLVLSGDPALSIPGAVVCATPAAVFECIRGLPEDSVFVIGGQQVYTLFLPYCRRAHITRFNRAFEADRFFPPLDALPGWCLDERSAPEIYEGLEYWYETYCQDAPVSCP